MKSNIIFQNKYCKLYFKDTFIILSSKKDIYNDIYFISFEESRQYMSKLGITI
jgi:hypothetical protein